MPDDPQMLALLRDKPVQAFAGMPPWRRVECPDIPVSWQAFLVREPPFSEPATFTLSQAQRNHQVELTNFPRMPPILNRNHPMARATMNTLSDPSILARSEAEEVGAGVGVGDAGTVVVVERVVVVVGVVVEVVVRVVVVDAIVVVVVVANVVVVRVVEVVVVVVAAVVVVVVVGSWEFAEGAVLASATMTARNASVKNSKSHLGLPLLFDHRPEKAGKSSGISGWLDAMARHLQVTCEHVS